MLAVGGRIRDEYVELPALPARVFVKKRAGFLEAHFLHVFVSALHKRLEIGRRTDGGGGDRLLRARDGRRRGGLRHGSRKQQSRKGSNRFPNAHADDCIAIRRVLSMGR